MLCLPSHAIIEGLSRHLTGVVISFGAEKMYLFVADLIHQLETLQGLLDADSNVLLCQGAGPEAVVKVEKALVRLHTQKGCHILIVGEGS